MLIDQLSQPLDRPIMALSAFSIQGKRNHMEDFFDIGYQIKLCDQRRANEWPYEYFYFGVFDGHGGSEAAKFAKQNLLKFITQQKDFWSNDDEDIMRAIRNGYAETHKAMREVMPSWNKTNRILPSTAGTTASVLFIKNGKFYTGHVGDSRIVISEENQETKQWISYQITDDHKPESEEETLRINRAGGEVKTKIGVHRVVWRRPVLDSAPSCELETPELQTYLNAISSYPLSESIVDSYQTIPFLSIARSLGDFWSINHHTGLYVVSPEPDVSCRPIRPNDKCILLATDGLWNVMNSSQAVRSLQELDIVKNGRRQYCEDEYFLTDNYYDVAGANDNNHAESLVYFAYQMWERRRLKSDNITVVVAMLNDILSHFHRPNKAYATRASMIHIGEDFYKHGKSEPKCIQLPQTNVFSEEIRLNNEPRFHLPNLDIYDEKWKQLESSLILPPTIMEENNFKHPKIVYPRNYMRLSVAICRKIPHPNLYSVDSYIYIKQVSDDPADERELPTRIGNSGKEVKDASAQATQSIHDFGQPWDQLLDENKDTCRDAKTVLMDVSDNEGEIVEEDSKEGIEEKKPARKRPLETKLSQLRCLLNYTPPLRRSSRNTYLSVSDNAKRKAHLTSSSVSKAKRRKSQPVRCNLSRA